MTGWPQGNPHYAAYYEDAEAAREAACRAGYAGSEGQSWYDFVDIALAKYRNMQVFAHLEEATKWLSSEIKAGKSCFGTGTIIHFVLPTEECAKCTCGGFWIDHEYSVDESGVIEDNALEPPCDSDDR